eukprot:CAMPEP_0113916636 /NCGR_PEP_ID=MMETSP0780_2-20120614/32191_1 /TAXON_ID=652834 /ORGANISM="Palpitomonas bilix" /LENGTH=1054 /DNA_ID=CAMNT_0000915925 /DNA_START=2139 /DNA_END=5303 /DNA_ORIENTATION=- /assembly_acc=CAM_ASM_000599
MEDRQQAPSGDGRGVPRGEIRFLPEEHSRLLVRLCQQLLHESADLIRFFSRNEMCHSPSSSLADITEKYRNRHRELCNGETSSEFDGGDFRLSFLQKRGLKEWKIGNRLLQEMGAVLRQVRLHHLDVPEETQRRERLVDPGTGASFVPPTDPRASGAPVSKPSEDPQRERKETGQPTKGSERSEQNRGLLPAHLPEWYGWVFHFPFVLKQMDNGGCGNRLASTLSRLRYALSSSSSPCGEPASLTEQDTDTFVKVCRRFMEKEEIVHLDFRIDSGCQHEEAIPSRGMSFVWIFVALDYLVHQGTKAGADVQSQFSKCLGAWFISESSFSWINSTKFPRLKDLIYQYFVVDPAAASGGSAPQEGNSHSTHEALPEEAPSGQPLTFSHFKQSPAGKELIRCLEHAFSPSRAWFDGEVQDPQAAVRMARIIFYLLVGKLKYWKLVQLRDLEIMGKKKMMHVSFGHLMDRLAKYHLQSWALGKLQRLPAEAWWKLHAAFLPTGRTHAEKRKEEKEKEKEEEPSTKGHSDASFPPSFWMHALPTPYLFAWIEKTNGLVPVSSPPLPQVPGPAEADRSTHGVGPSPASELGQSIWQRLDDAKYIPFVSSLSFFYDKPGKKMRGVWEKEEGEEEEKEEPPKKGKNQKRSSKASSMWSPVLSERLQPGSQEAHVASLETLFMRYVSARARKERSNEKKAKKALPSVYRRALHVLQSLLPRTDDIVSDQTVTRDLRTLFTVHLMRKYIRWWHSPAQKAFKDTSRLSSSLVASVGPNEDPSSPCPELRFFDQRRLLCFHAPLFLDRAFSLPFPLSSDYLVEVSLGWKGVPEDIRTWYTSRAKEEPNAEGSNAVPPSLSRPERAPVATWASGPPAGPHFKTFWEWTGMPFSSLRNPHLNFGCLPSQEWLLSTKNRRERSRETPSGPPLPLRASGIGPQDLLLSEVERKQYLLRSSIVSSTSDELGDTFLSSIGIWMEQVSQLLERRMESAQDLETRVTVKGQKIWTFVRKRWERYARKLTKGETCSSHIQRGFSSLSSQDEESDESPSDEEGSEGSDMEREDLEV